MKTASFSQCLKMTVITKIKGGKCLSYCWDLEHVRKTDRWEIIPGAGTLVDEAAKSLGSSGTVVLWEKLDRACDSDSEAEDPFSSQGSFLSLAGTVEVHLGLIFHRFLEGPRKIRLSLNGNAIKPWDPFLRDHASSQNPERTEIPFKDERVVVSCHVLPHHSKLSESEWQAAGGPSGWTAAQGFYLYRNRRLIVPGDWMGLGLRKEDHHKLARISIDVSNSLDQYWDLDVKKSRALIPPGLRRNLANLAKATRARAAEIYKHRGKIVSRSTSKASFLWIQKTIRSKLHYEISRDHPSVVAVIAETGGRKSCVETLLRLIEEALPVPAIVLECSQKEDVLAKPFEGVAEQDIYRIFARSISALTSTGGYRGAGDQQCA